MKTVRKNVVVAGLVGAATLFLAVPVAMSAVPGMGWDVFNVGEGEPIPEGSSYRGTAMYDAPSQGFDVFNSGEGVKVEDYRTHQQAYIGTSSLGSEASGSWDVFRIGDGDPLP